MNLKTNDKRIASLRHTGVMVLILIIFSIYGSLANSSSNNTITSSSKTILYLVMVLGEWALLYYVYIGVKKYKSIKFISLVSGDDKLKFRLDDFLKGFIFWIIANIFLYLIKYLLGLPILSNTNENLLPQNIWEYLVFFLLALSAGFCEEVIYRGYFQRQFSSIFRNKWIAISTQGFLFGISHGYQGIKYILVISVYGILFGLLVNLVKNLKPGIIAHSWQDVFSGIIFKGT